MFRATVIVVFIFRKRMTRSHANRVFDFITTKNECKMLVRLKRRYVLDTSALFNGHFVDAKALYLLMHRQIPSVSFVSEMDGTKAFAHLKTILGNDVMSIVQHSYFNHDKKEFYFINTLFLVRGQRMIELADNYCHLLHNGNQYKWTVEVARELATYCRVVTKAQERTTIGFVRNTDMN
jgi:hypothetical protein